MSEALKRTRPRVSRAKSAAPPRSVRSSSVAGRSRGPSWLSGHAGAPVAFAGTVQRKVVIGAANDRYEREADSVADQVAGGQAVSPQSISRVSPGQLNPVAQRQSEEPETEESGGDSVQTLAVQREADDEQAGDEESVQTFAVQRQSEDEGAAEEEPVQTQAIQREPEEGAAEEEPVQQQTVQRQSGDEAAADEEPVQTVAIQRQEEQAGEDGGVAEEEPVQTHAVQRETDGGEEAEPIQEKSNASANAARPPSMGAAAGRAIQQRGAGAPIESSTRRTLESRVGVGLGGVRVHTGPAAEEATSALKARAFTHGKDIWLGKGESTTDVRLLAHETTHVLQQDGVVRRAPATALEDKEETSSVSGGREPEEREEDKSTALPEPAPATVEESTREVPSSTEALPGTRAPLDVSQPSSVAAEPARGTEPEREEPAEDEAAPVPSATGAEPTTATAPETPVADQPAGSQAPSAEPTAGPTGTAPTAAAASEVPGGQPTSEGGAAAAAAVTTTSEKPPTPAATTAPDSKPKEAEQEPATPSPQEDPRFRGVMKRLDRSAAKEKSHAPASTKVAQARAAALAPANDRSSRAQAAQVDTMATQQPRKPETESFLALLRRKLAAIAPKNMEETEEFKKKGKAAELKQSMTGAVKSQKESSEKDIAAATRAEPDPNSVAPKDVVTMPAERSDGAPARIHAKNVLPQPKKPEQISAQHNKDEADRLMADNDIDEEQLQKANEPQFTGALESKRELEEHADKVPEAYREEEGNYLTEAKLGVGREEADSRQQMRGQRNQAKQDVRTRQTEAQKREEAERKKVSDKIETMYGATRKKVEDKLAALDGEVNTLFDEGERRARDRFETDVERQMSAYKRRRYGGFGGGALWLKDKFFDLPDEVNRFYETAREQYLKDMDTVLVRIADKVESRLKEAKDDIAKGREKIRTYVAELPKTLQHAGKEAEGKVSDKFDDLKRNVDSKKQQLAQQLAKRYQDARNKLDARIKELQAQNKGLLSGFIAKIKEIIEILRKFKERVVSMMKSGADTVRKIVKDPIGFLKQLLTAVGKGFGQFSDRILTHLKKGLVGWLFGSLARTGIQIPTEFSVKAIFGVVLGVLGITRDRIRAKVVKLIGAKNVGRIEKAWEVVSTVISEGPAGLWKRAKDFLGNLKEMVLGAIRDWLITQIIKQAVIWLVSLFNPVAALIKAIKLIIDVVMFFVENIERILKLVEAVIQSIAYIVAGKIAAAANFIEDAMSRTVPIIISFLARILGLSGIADKIKSFIKRIQKRVDKAIDKVLKKIVKGIKKLFGKGKAAAKKVAGKVKELIFPKKRFKVGTESHSFEAKSSKKGDTIVVRSKSKSIPQVVKDARKHLKSTPTTALQNKVDKLEADYSAWKGMKKDTEAAQRKKSNAYVALFKLTTDIMKATDTTPGVRMSSITWDALDTRGRAKGVTANPLTAKGPKGGTPSESIPGGDTAYEETEIRAHLLHHKMHGPGKRFNMTPTSRSINGLMLNQVEKHALDALGIKSKTTGKPIPTRQNSVELTYTTKVRYGNPSDPKLKDAAKHIDMTAKGKNVKTGQTLGPWTMSEDNY